MSGELDKGVQDLIDRIRRSRGMGPGALWGGGLVIVGAGCSASAGIPTAMGIVDLALRHLGRTRLQQTDAETANPKRIYEDLKADGLAFASPYGPQLYYEIFDEQLDESNEQRLLIGEAIEQGQGKINWAHIRLGQLVSERCVHTIITTNFDRLIQEGLRRANVIAAIADGLEAFNRIESRPAFPQIIHLHGSAHNYSLRNSRRHVSDVGRATPTKGALYGLMQHAPFLLVVGYRGEEEGLMHPLKEALTAFPERRVFWALHGDEDDIPLQVRDLRKTGCVLTFLSKIDADNLFDVLAIGARLDSPSWMRDPISSLLRDHLDVVCPPNPNVQKLLQTYGDELDILSKALSVQRQQAVHKEQKRRMEEMAATSRDSLLSDLKTALSANEFYLEFQPIIDLKQNRIVAAEALLRWQRPKHGRTLPADFIEVAEDAGLLQDIGSWIIRSAGRIARGWPPNVGVTMNIWSAQFREGSMVETIKDILRETGLSPHLIEIEITEDTVLEASSTVPKVLTQLHELGVRFSIDKFGTGHSSLSHLRRFNFDSLKIDSSFVREIPHNLAIQAVIKAIVSLAHSLSITARAEGVESEEQLIFLKSFGYAQMQGLYFYPPMPAEKLLELLIQQISY